jgi:hypothetical protein
VERGMRDGPVRNALGIEEGEDVLGQERHGAACSGTITARKGPRLGR